MGGLRGRELKADMGLRAMRMSRLSDSRLLDIFMVARKQNLAQGFSVLEANERAHVAVEAGMAPAAPVSGIIEPVELG